MPTAAHKGAIAFGMIYIPVSLYTATSSTGISFNQLTADGKSRIQYRKVRADNGQEVSSSEIVKGYQYQKDKYVVITDDEIERLKTPKDKTITILHFCPMGSVPVVFFEKSYNVVPDGSDKAYALLLSAMQEENMMAIASTVLGTKETLVAIIPSENSLALETLYYLEEIKAVPKPVTVPQLSGQELEMAKMVIHSMVKEFDATQYHDTYRERMLSAIQAKIEGQQIVAPQQDEKPNNVVNMMEALQQMLAMQGQTMPPPVPSGYNTGVHQ